MDQASHSISIAKTSFKKIGALTGCLVDPQNSEIILIDPEKPEFYMILCPGP